LLARPLLATLPLDASDSVAGRTDLDVKEWRAHSTLDVRLDADTFWHVVEGLTADERSLLLAFVTGSPALPSGGFAALQGFGGGLQPFKVVMEPDNRRLPTASTCFNTLYLPRYESEEEMVRQLRRVLHESAAPMEG